MSTAGALLGRIQPGRRATRHREDAARWVAALRRGAGLLRTGLPPVEAWRTVAVWELEAAPACPRTAAVCCLGHALETLAATLRVGADPARVPSPDHVEQWDTFLGILALSAQTGVAAGAAVESLAHALDAHRDAQAAADGALAGPRASVRLLRWLPLGGLGLAWLLGAGPATLLGSLWGWLTLSAGLMFAMAGQVWTRRLIERARPSGATLEAAVLLDLLSGLVRGGRGELAALGDLSAVTPGARGLAAVVLRLQWGSAWSAAWSAVADREALVCLSRHLRPLFRTGVAGGATLAVAAAAVRSQARRASDQAAEELAVKLVVPVGLCHLPAFVCVGVVPLMVAILSGPAG
ncbi:MAG: secretion system protein F [Micrococcus sp.]|nr:secretion system protein F [Micrococcus sp.]